MLKLLDTVRDRETGRVGVVVGGGPKRALVRFDSGNLLLRYSRLAKHRSGEPHEPDPEKKVCTRCKKEKHKRNFYHRQSYCRKCNRDYHRQRRNMTEREKASLKLEGILARQKSAWLNLLEAGSLTALQCDEAQRLIEDATAGVALLNGVLRDL